MNKVVKIFEILKTLNLEPYERFIVVDKGKVYCFDYGLDLYDPYYECYVSEYECDFKKILTGECEIVKVSDLTSEDKKVISEARKKGAGGVIATIENSKYHLTNRHIKWNERVLWLDVFDKNGNCK